MENGGHTLPVSSPSQNDEADSAEIIDPESLLSSLTFRSPSDQASYECLKSAAYNTAVSDGMQAMPVSWNDNPVGGRGSFLTWCLIPGTGALAEDDLLKCASGTIGFSLKSPGTQAISITTKHFSSDGMVNVIGHSTARIPRAENAGWSVFYLKKFSDIYTSESSLRFEFERFDGSQLTGEVGQLRHPYIYTDSDIELVEFIHTDRSINEYLADYQGSASLFKSTVDAYLTSLLPKIEDAIRMKTGLSGAATNAALERASAEITRTREFFKENGDDVHSLIVEQTTYLECEGGA